MFPLLKIGFIWLSMCMQSMSMTVCLTRSVLKGFDFFFLSFLICKRHKKRPKMFESKVHSTIQLVSD